MPRIRTIKPEFWTDKKVASWPLFTRLLYIGLWTAADDHGRGSAEPARLAAEIFPYDLLRDSRGVSRRIAASLGKLAEDCRIVLYEVNGETYYEVANWSKHQRMDNAGKPKVPTPYDDGAKVSRRLAATRGDSRLEQGTGNREQGTELMASAICSELCSDDQTPSPRPAEDASPVVMEFPCNGTRRKWQLRQSRIDQWREAFPAVDVLAECRRALAWINDNPTKRKTANGMAKFLGAWLGRVQDRSGQVPTTAAAKGKRYPTSQDWDAVFGSDAEGGAA